MKNTRITPIQMLSSALGILAQADDQAARAEKASGFQPPESERLKRAGHRA